MRQSSGNLGSGTESPDVIRDASSGTEAGGGFQEKERATMSNIHDIEGEEEKKH